MSPQRPDNRKPRTLADQLIDAGLAPRDAAAPPIARRPRDAATPTYAVDTSGDGRLRAMAQEKAARARRDGLALREEQARELARRVSSSDATPFFKIDASFLPAGWTEVGEGERRDGLVAVFYADGQVKEVGYYVGGHLASDLLRLSHGEPSGTSGTPEMWVAFRSNGTVERYSAWDDASPLEAHDWLPWVREEIARIAAARASDRARRGLSV